MRKYILLSIILLFLFSCKIKPNSSKQDANFNKGKELKLALKPSAGSKYYYDIDNETEIELQVNDNKVDNINRTNAGVYYEINYDSSGDFIFNMSYDKIILYANKGDGESIYDAANAATSLEPVEKMLGALKTTIISATVSPTGDIKSVNGYKELVQKIMSGFNLKDDYSRRIVQRRCEQLIEEGVIKKNMKQLFKIFPNSALHIGDKWKIDLTQKVDLNLHTINNCTLKQVTNGIAFIEVEGELVSDSAAGNLMGNDVTTDLRGKQHGEYEIAINTGMLLNSELTAKVEGTIQMMGRNIPVIISMKSKMKCRNENGQ